MTLNNPAGINEFPQVEGKTLSPPSLFGGHPYIMRGSHYCGPINEKENYFTSIFQVWRACLPLKSAFENGAF